MSNIRSYFTFFILLLVQGFAWCQVGVSDRINQETDRAPSLEKLLEVAVKEFDDANYHGAMQRYLAILKADSLNTVALKGYGESAIKYFALDSAEMAFQKLVDHKLTAPDGAPILRLAEVKYQLGKYEEARQLYQRFLFTEKPAGATEAMKFQAEKRLEDCEWALETLSNPVLHPDLFMLLDSNVNTAEYAEHSPFMLGDVLYFTSAKFLFNKDKEFPKRNLNKILTIEGESLSAPAKLAGLNAENHHTANTTFNSAGTAVYYSICDFIGSKYKLRCDIYRRFKMPDGAWSDAQKLPEKINTPGFTTTEPSVGPVPGENYEMLYYVSDRPGGKGGKDIWCAKIMADSFSMPMNLTTLNTTGDDVTPFYYGPEHTLYFSSDSLQTLGGFDIYKSVWNGDNWGEPKNMGAPINSGSNDVYFSTPDNKLAFMASNRRGSFNQSEEGCCYDIYELDFVKPQMSAITYLKKDGVKTDQILGYTTLTLIEVGNPAAKPQKVELDASGQYKFDLLPGKTYKLIGEKDRYFADSVTFTTPTRPWRKEIVQKLYLEPSTPNLIVTVYDKDTGKPLNGTTARLFDLGRRLPNGNFVASKGLTPQTDSHADNNKYEYPLDTEHRYQAVASKPGYTVDSTSVISTEGIKGAKTLEAKVYLQRGLTFKAHTINRITGDTLYGVTYRLLELPAEKQKDQYTSSAGKNYETTLNYEKRYRIIASKDGFSSDSIDFSTANLPKIDFQTITKELRLRPLNLDAYLPIPLYFDNDEPDKRTLATSTAREYRATYVDYIRRKDEFIARYTEGMGGEDLKTATDSLDVFFEKDVRGGWNRLMEFSEVLYDMLTRGDSIEITLKGYASPRAGTLYNKNLTDRRVSSVYNHFDIFDGGIYKRFVDSGQLVIKRQANGETKAPKGISDNIKDERKSIYDVRASRERRLEIVGVRVNKEKKL